ncbi:MAG: HAD family hydrolase [Firmicutes bacterium]|nr:HAD family hydrolase [Bacillota bacterium]
MLTTVLFDLDGTMLPLDLNKFIQIYFTEMGKKFHDLIDPETLVDYIMTATEAMVNDTSYRTNETVFMEKFAELIESDLKVYRKRFDEFYDREFFQTKSAVVDSPLMRESVKLLKEKGYHLIIATNPLFPEKAIHHRIRWSGFEPEDFIYITSYERNHYCKPRFQFYLEVLQETGKQPHECLMVGNDVQEDLVVSQLGVETFLITDFLINRSTEPITSTYQGNYADFYRFVKNLPDIAIAETKKMA